MSLYTTCSICDLPGWSLGKGGYTTNGCLTELEQSSESCGDLTCETCIPCIVKTFTTEKVAGWLDKTVVVTSQGVFLGDKDSLRNNEGVFTLPTGECVQIQGWDETEADASDEGFFLHHACYNFIKNTTKWSDTELYDRFMNKMTKFASFDIDYNIPVTSELVGSGDNFDNELVWLIQKDRLWVLNTPRKCDKNRGRIEDNIRCIIKLTKNTPKLNKNKITNKQI
jgi:hypothetical protein